MKSNNKSSKIVSDILVSNKIATRNDNFYAWRCLKALGINVEDKQVSVDELYKEEEFDLSKEAEKAKKSSKKKINAKPKK